VVAALVEKQQVVLRVRRILVAVVVDLARGLF
jgi:hypothetical protein